MVSRTHRRSICHRERAALVGFESNLLGQHDISRDEISVWYKAPAANGQTDIVEFLDVHLHAVVDTVDSPTIATDNIKMPMLLIRRELFRGEPILQQL